MCDESGWENFFKLMDSDGSGEISLTELVGGFEKHMGWDHQKAIDVADVSNISLINPYSAGTDFSRQNLTSVDVRFCRLKSIPKL